jgi:phage shock protein A
LADLDARNATLDAGVADTAQTIERFRDELAALKRRLTETEAQRTSLAAAESAYQAASADAAALRASASWKVTAPLRALYDALSAVRPRGPR